MTTDQFPFLDDLRAGLVRAASHERARRRRRRRLALAAAGAGTLVAGLLALSLLGDRGEGAALAITRDDRGIVVRIADADASPEELTAELQAAGIEAQVRAVPVSPSLAGKWIDIEGFGQHEEIAHRVDLRLPAGFKGRLRLDVGRPARPGERYALTQSAFRPGEPLHCRGIEGLAPAEAETAIRRLGYEPTWRLASTTGPPAPGDKDGAPTPLWGPVTRTRPEGVIIDARLSQNGASQRTIEVTVAPSDDPIVTNPRSERHTFGPATSPKDCK
jgi:hypothetical protein